MQKNNLLTTDNWKKMEFRNGSLRSILSFGMSPDFQDEYIHTVCDEDYQEIYEAIFTSLDEALVFMNDRYRSWALLLRGGQVATEEASGCSTCAAH